MHGVTACPAVVVRSRALDLWAGKNTEDGLSMGTDLSASLLVDAVLTHSGIHRRVRRQAAREAVEDGRAQDTTRVASKNLALAGISSKSLGSAVAGGKADDGRRAASLFAADTGDDGGNDSDDDDELEGSMLLLSNARQGVCLSSMA